MPNKIIGAFFILCLYSQAFLDVGSLDGGAMDSGRMRKGLLWQQRDKLFSRWKERYFTLTRDLLQCFKRNAGKVSDMGEFLFKVSLLS